MGDRSTAFTISTFVHGGLRAGRSTIGRCRPRPYCVRACAKSNGVAKPPKFTMEKIVMPADTDYSGTMWHGSYVRYLEEARVLWLRNIGVNYDELVNEQFTELVVSELNVRYRAPGRMGDVVQISVEPERGRGVRLPIKCDLTKVENGLVLATADVTLAPVSTKNGKLCRRLPASLIEALVNAEERAWM